MPEAPGPISATAPIHWQLVGPSASESQLDSETSLGALSPGPAIRRQREPSPLTLSDTSQRPEAGRARQEQQEQLNHVCLGFFRYRDKHAPATRGSGTGHRSR